MEPFTGILGEIEEVAGREAAVTLSVLHGGQRLYIPKRIVAADWLSREIGDSPAKALAERFGGIHLDMPLGVGIRAQIRILRDANKTISEIAIAVRRTERYVYQVLAAGDSQGPCHQGRLFG